VTDILTNDEISLLRSLEKKSRTITGNFTHKRYDRLETKGRFRQHQRAKKMPLGCSYGMGYPPNRCRANPIGLAFASCFGSSATG
jgi:hypothetical protein